MPVKKLFLFPVIFWFSVKSQTFNDFSFILNEKAVNKIFSVIGEISGKNNYEVLLVNGEYTWIISNPKINLLPDSSDFTCDARVAVGPFSYKSKVIGNVKIGYDNKLNEISIKITRAIFELYTMVLGNKLHIKDIHLEDYFKDPFVFEGPKSFATDMQFTMPDSTLKKIYVQPTECIMRVIKQCIITSCEIAASDKPFKQTIKVLPPIQPNNKTPMPPVKK